MPNGVVPEPLTVCVVTHTHWDREWYHSASRFRQQLVALVDTLFERPESAAFPFLLDGQAVVLEDYLAVRPEMAERVGSALRTGAIEAGPWYVLADGLIPSGEAIVRNLLAGRRVLRRFGAAAPAVAYCPDTFGHSAAIPAIAHGFGFSLAIVWRGYGGARWPSGDVARWRAPSGESVLLYHLPPDGYETGSALPTESAQVIKRWESFRELMAKRAATGVVLLPNGADHHALQPDIADAIAALQHISQPDKVVRESLAGFAKRVVESAALRAAQIPVVTGELRDSYGYTWTLGGTFGTRAAQKRANARAERMLLRDVEPWLALAWLQHERHATAFTGNAVITMAQTPALLDAAWRTLLRAHPHDTLCGCSIDAVARAMDVRVESAILQARGLRDAALNLALGRVSVAARSGPLADVAQLVVRNRTARWRGGLAEVIIDETMGDAPVGPSSATRSSSAAEQVPTSRSQPDVAGFPLQVIDSKLVFRRRESPQHYPDNDCVRAHRALVWLPAVPPIGLAVFPLRFASPSELTMLSASERPSGAESERVHVGNIRGAETNSAMVCGETIRTTAEETHSTKIQSETMPRPVTIRMIGDEIELANDRLTVVIGAQGIRITRGARTLQNVLTIESTADVGDSYTPAIRGEPELLRITSVKARLSGPLRCSASAEFRSTRKRRGIHVRATITLDTASDALRIDIVGNNQRRDHRLRVNFNTDIVASKLPIKVYADAAFGPVERAPLNVPAHDQTREMVPPTMPMHRWATMCTADAGATLHADGLAEVEADQTTGAISLTLLRAIGELSRADLPERPGHAGWPAPIPMAQSLGIFHARIGFQLHGPWTQQTRDEIEESSDSLLLPLVAETIRDLNNAPEMVIGPSLEGTALRATAIMPADDGEGIVLRCVNDSNELQQGQWKLASKGPLEFAHARLDETLETPWMSVESEFKFVAQPRAIATIRVRRAATSE